MTLTFTKCKKHLQMTLTFTNDTYIYKMQKHLQMTLTFTKCKNIYK